MPVGIDIVALIGIVVAGLALLGVAAQRWGADTRELDSRSPQPWIGGR